MKYLTAKFKYKKPKTFLGKDYYIAKMYFIYYIFIKDMEIARKIKLIIIKNNNKKYVKTCFLLFKF